MFSLESQDIEYKESWRDEYLKWICGFANAHGGKIYIGINDNKEIVGITKAKRLMEDIPNKIVNYLGIVADVNLLKEKGKEYIEIIVKPNSIPISFKGAYHYRSGATKQELKGVALQHFIMKNMGRSWDDIENEQATLEDIDRDAIDYFLNKAIVSNRMPADSINNETRHILYNLNLLTNEGKIKNAALLLFAKKPSRFFTSADFRIGRFIKDDSDLIFQDVIDGNIIQMADKVINLLRSKYLTSPISYKGLSRIETLEMPEDALREAIFNSIIHKDYTGVHTQLKVFNNYLWLWNSGELPMGMTVENLMRQHTSQPRNKNIANIFYKAGFIESWGRGIKKIRDGFEKVGIKAPKFESAFGGVTVMMYRNNDVVENVVENVVGNVVEKINLRQQQIIKFISENNRLSADELSKMLDVTNRTVQRDLDKLKALSLIKRIGADKGGYWNVKEE